MFIALISSVLCLSFISSRKPDAGAYEDAKKNIRISIKEVRMFFMPEVFHCFPYTTPETTESFFPRSLYFSSSYSA